VRKTSDLSIDYPLPFLKPENVAAASLLPERLDIFSSNTPLQKPHHKENDITSFTVPQRIRKNRSFFLLVYE
jgi:hypothetical protein